MDLKEKTCAYCGKTFKPTVPLNKFCSRECAIKSHKKPKAVYNIKCAVCGKKITAHKKSTLYCSYECRLKARYKRISLARKKRRESKNEGNNKTVS